jgi:hypothetical protein
MAMMPRGTKQMDTDMTTDRRRTHQRDRFIVTVTYNEGTEDYGFMTRPKANKWFDQMAQDPGVVKVVITGPLDELVALYLRGSV